MLDDLEAIRMGDPVAKFERAVRGCKIWKADADSMCIVTAGAFRFQAPWKLLWKVPEDRAYYLSELFARAGLRYWRLTAFSRVERGRTQEVSVTFSVMGRYEALGTTWTISESAPAHSGLEIVSPDQQRTYTGWYRITSLPSGEGFTIHGTSGSAEKELACATNQPLLHVFAPRMRRASRASSGRDSGSGGAQLFVGRPDGCTAVQM